MSRKFIHYCGQLSSAFMDGRSNDYLDCLDTVIANLSFLEDEMEEETPDIAMCFVGLVRYHMHQAENRYDEAEEAWKAVESKFPPGKKSFRKIVLTRQWANELDNAHKYIEMAIQG